MRRSGTADTYQIYHPDYGIEDRKVSSYCDFEFLAHDEAERKNDEGYLTGGYDWFALRLEDGEPWQWFQVTAEPTIEYRTVKEANAPDGDWWGFKDFVEMLKEPTQ